MRIYACANLKGGVGKTTTAVHLAAALARLNRRVLAIDIDQQADFTTWVGPEEEARLTIVDVMRRPSDGALLRRAIAKSRIAGVDLIPGSPSMEATWRWGAAISACITNLRQAALTPTICIAGRDSRSTSFRPGSEN